MDSSGNITSIGTVGCGAITTTGNIVIPNAGNIGSVSDTDAISISSGGNIGIGGIDSSVENLEIYDTGEVKLGLNSAGTFKTRFFSRTSDDTFGIYDATRGKTYFRYKSHATIGSTVMRLVESGGRVGIGVASPDVELDVNGSIEYTGTITDTSDDRIKYNEKNINTVTALNVINQITPKYYEKLSKRPANSTGRWIPTDDEWESVKDNYNWHYETGIIAQEVKEISELEYCVHGTEITLETITDPDTGIETQVTSQTPLYLTYNDIFTYNIAATKELTEQLNAEKRKVSNLETELAAIKTHLGL